MSGLRIVVTGATGTIGRGLLPQLQERGDVGSIVAVGSRPDPTLPPGGKLEYAEVDVRDGAALVQAFRGADVVVHLAFALYGLRQSESELHDINVGGTANVFAAARENGAERFVYTSSAAVYGYRPDNPQPIPETVGLRPDPRHFYSRQKAAVERFLAEQAGEGAPEIVIFRPCAVVGPHGAGAAAHGLPKWLDPIADQARRLYGRGVRPLLPGPPVPLQFVHEEDVGAAIVAAIFSEEAAGTYNLAGDGVLEGGEVVRALGMRPLPVPRGLTSAAVRLLSAAPKPFVPGAAWLHVLAHPLLLDTSEARQRLGWRPRYTSRQALESMRAAMSTG